MNKQKGITLVGMLLVAGGIFFIALIAMKIVPAYIEFFSVKKVLSAMASDPALPTMSVKEIRESFGRRASIDNISAVKGADLDISRVDGETVVTAEYSVKTPLFGNLSAWMDFSGSTAKNSPSSKPAGE